MFLPRSGVGILTHGCLADETGLMLERNAGRRLAIVCAE